MIIEMETVKEKRIALEKKITNNRMRLLGAIVSPKVQLNEDEQRNYESWVQKFKENPKLRESKFLTPYKDEKDYLVRELKKQIEFDKMLRTQYICDEKGHVEREGSSHIASGPGGTRAYAHCKRCKMMYARGLNSKESESFSKLLHTRFM